MENIFHKIVKIVKGLQLKVFFHKIFGEGDSLSGMIFGPRRGRSQMGGTSHRGQGQMREDLEKLSAETKNAPYSKIRANVGVLSIK